VANVIEPRGERQDKHMPLAVVVAADSSTDS
jgi:hypothetical protein